MSTCVTRFAFVLALLGAPVLAQEPAGEPAQPEPPKAAAPAPEEAPAPEAPAPDETNKTEEPDKEASAAPAKPRIVKTEQGDEVKLLSPKDVPAELTRLKSKADIKAEITVQPHGGRAATFKGVIRNGKLIEAFLHRRFVPLRDLENPRCGVRLWWIGNSSGWMFFRYSNIRTLALTGQLTAEERREIMHRLKAHDEEEAQKKRAEQEKQADADLEKMSPSELEAYLLRTYPADKGWDRKRHKALKQKQIIENKPLTRDEAVFVKYYRILIEARLKALKAASKRNVIEFEPGSEEKPASPDESAKPDGGPDDGSFPLPPPSGN